MKKFALVLIALGAIATAASASQRNGEYPIGQIVVGTSVSSPLAAADTAGNSASDIQARNAMFNASSSHN